MTQVEVVKKICKERSISIHKLEMDCGFANGYISQLKKGVFPTERAIIIAQYLDIPIDYLIGKTTNSFVKIEGLPNYVFNAATGTLIPSKENQDPAAVDFLRNQNTIKLSEDAIDVAAQYAIRPPEIQEMIRNLLKLSEPRS